LGEQRRQQREELQEQRGDQDLAQQPPVPHHKTQHLAVSRVFKKTCNHREKSQ
jgi:hypothetical protein